jgi:hypothetical protein
MVAAATAELRVLETFIAFSFRREGWGPSEVTGRLAGQLLAPYELPGAGAVGRLRQHM